MMPEFPIIRRPTGQESTTRKSIWDLSRPPRLVWAWVVDVAGQVWTTDQSGRAVQWSIPDQLPVVEISAGLDGQVWLIGRHRFRTRVLRRRTGGQRFEPVDISSEVRKIAAGPDGTLWTIMGFGQVWSVSPDGVQTRQSPPREPFAEEISVGADGTVWIVTDQPRLGGRVVMRRSGGCDNWIALPEPAAATKIAGAADGMAWTVNANNEVWWLHPDGAGHLAQCTLDPACRNCRFSSSSERITQISVSADGTVWVVASTVANAEPSLMWLADPLEKVYRRVPGLTVPARVSAGVGAPILANEPAGHDACVSF